MIRSEVRAYLREIVGPEILDAKDPIKKGMSTKEEVKKGMSIKEEVEKKSYISPYSLLKVKEEVPEIPYHHSR